MVDDMIQKFTVHDSYTGSDITCNFDQSVLSAIELDGRCDVPIGCRGGGCGRCRIDVLYGDYRCGKMSRVHAPPEAIEKGRVLACRIYPESHLIINTAPNLG